MKHNPILQGAMLSTHGTKSGMGNREDFLFSSVSIFHPLFFGPKASFIILLCAPSFHKSRDEISFKGEGRNTPYYKFFNYLP
jgi:hypothetical protein